MLTLGSLLIVGILKFAIVPAYLLDATCTPAYAAGSALKVLETGRIDWRPLEELIMVSAGKVAPVTVWEALEFVSVAVKLPVTMVPMVAAGRSVCEVWGTERRSN